MAEGTIDRLSEILLGELVTSDLIWIRLLAHDGARTSPEGSGVLGHGPDVLYGPHRVGTSCMQTHIHTQSIINLSLGQRVMMYIL